MRSISRRPWLSNRQSSTFSAFAENSAKLVPRPSHLAPDGCGAPAEIRTLPLRNEKNCRKGRNNKTYVGNCALVQRPDCALVPDIAAAAIQRGVAVEDLAPRPRKWNFDAIVAIESPAGEGGQGHYGRLEALHEQKRRIIGPFPRWVRRQEPRAGRHDRDPERPKQGTGRECPPSAENRRDRRRHRPVLRGGTGAV